MTRDILDALASAAEEQGAELVDARLEGESLRVRVDCMRPLDGPRFRARACWQYHVESAIASPAQSAVPKREVLRQFVHMDLARR